MSVVRRTWPRYRKSGAFLSSRRAIALAVHSDIYTASLVARLSYPTLAPHRAPYDFISGLGPALAGGAFLSAMNQLRPDRDQVASLTQLPACRCVFFDRATVGDD